MPLLKKDIPPLKKGKDIPPFEKGGRGGIFSKKQVYGGQAQRVRQRAEQPVGLQAIQPNLRKLFCHDYYDTLYQPSSIYSCQLSHQIS